MFLAGLLSFGTASANPAPPATASGVGFLDTAGGIAPADGLAGRPTPVGEFLSPLGMPPEGANPPAQTPATDLASSGDQPARPGKDVPRQASSPTEHGEPGSGAPGIPSADAALDEHGHKERISLDTPGCSPKDSDMGLDPALFPATDADMDTHLILAATMSAADPTSAIDRFEMFRPSRLPFTRLDRAETFGSIPNQATRTAKPVLFLAAGQQIPEDPEPASRERMVDLAPGRQATASLAPAQRPWRQGRKKQTTNAFVSHKHGIPRRGAGTVDHGAPATSASDRQTNSRTAAGKRRPRGSDLNRCARPHRGR